MTDKDGTLEIKDVKNANSTQFWIPSLSLYMSDYYALTEDRWLSDSIIHACQMMLKEAFPMIGGFQATTLGEVLAFEPETAEFVQISGGQWCLGTSVRGQRHSGA